MADQIAKLRCENNDLKRKLAEAAGQIAKLKNQNGKLNDENVELKGQIKTTDDKMFANLSNNKIAELKKGGIKFKFDIIELKENKWNSAERGKRMAISEGEGGRVVKHSGPAGWNCVRTEMPIKFNLSAKNPSIGYFEVEILKTTTLGGICIGLCMHKFPLEGNYYLGNMQNSIGIYGKWGMQIDGFRIKFGNAAGGGQFQTGNVIGIGIVHFPANSTMKCFATSNGQLLGWAELPIKFADLELFPAITMYYAKHSICANFGAALWKYPLGEIFNYL